MIPPYISPEVKSSGEKQLFERFKLAPGTEDWTVLHSLFLTRHVKRLYGEIDFLIMAPKLGIFVIEVKSGDVTRKGGVWFYGDRFGNKNRSNIGPFIQAKDGMFTLMNEVSNKFGNNHSLTKIIYGYGVMFPHMDDRIDGVDIDQWRIYYRGSHKYPVTGYIKTLSKKHMAKLRSKSWFDKDKSLPTKSQVNKLVQFFRGDFERISNLNERGKLTEKQLSICTERQYACLDILDLERNKTLVFQGSAGTGKTMIAIEHAKRLALQNKRILFTCYNPLLSAWLKQLLSDYTSIDVFTFHQFMYSITKLENDSPDEEYYNETLPLHTVIKLDEGSTQQYDYIIVDEAQDLITGNYLDVMDIAIKGGLNAGNSAFFGDFERQAIYSDKDKDNMFETIKNRSGSPVFMNLNVNCRNSREISRELSIMCELEKQKLPDESKSGIPVRYYFKSTQKEKINSLKLIISQLAGNKVPLSDITILSPHVLQKSITSNIVDEYKVVDLTRDNTVRLNKKFSGVLFSTIHAYKGLENSHIIITDLTTLSSDEIQSLLYVAISRARIGLNLIIDKSCKKEYENILKERLIK